MRSTSLFLAIFAGAILSGGCVSSPNAATPDKVAGSESAKRGLFGLVQSANPPRVPGSAGSRPSIGQPGVSGSVTTDTAGAISGMTAVASGSTNPLPDIRTPVRRDIEFSTQ